MDYLNFGQDVHFAHNDVPREKRERNLSLVS